MKKNKRKIINVVYGGRCGNQMFQYAFARSIQNSFYKDYQFIFSFSGVEKSGAVECGWEDSLKYFRTIDYEKGKCKLTPMQYLVSAFYVAGKKISPYAEIKFQNILNKVGIYALRMSSFTPVRKTNASSIYIRGRFEAHEYFDAIREQLIREFTPKLDVLEHNKQLYYNIINSESVCVTIRRGDFLDKGNEKFNTCTSNYFINAMNEIKQELPSAKFFVFSDSIEEIKKYYNFSCDVVYENGSDPIWEK